MKYVLKKLLSSSWIVFIFPALFTGFFFYLLYDAFVAGKDLAKRFIRWI